MKREETKTLWKMVDGREIGFTFDIISGERPQYRGLEGDAYPGTPAYAEYSHASRALSAKESEWLENNIEELAREALEPSAYDAFEHWWEKRPTLMFS